MSGMRVRSTTTSLEKKKNLTLFVGHFCTYVVNVIVYRYSLCWTCKNCVYSLNISRCIDDNLKLSLILNLFIFCAYVSSSCEKSVVLKMPIASPPFLTTQQPPWELLVTYRGMQMSKQFQREPPCLVFSLQKFLHN